LTRGFGSDANPRDGDRVKIEVDLEGGVVMEARSTGSGCEVSPKASSDLTRLVRGRARSERWRSARSAPRSWTRT